MTSLQVYFAIGSGIKGGENREFDGVGHAHPVDLSTRPNVIAILELRRKTVRRFWGGSSTVAERRLVWTGVHWNARSENGVEE